MTAVTLNFVLIRILRKFNFHRSVQAYFIGYPKTGNTWTRVMVGRYVQLACKLGEIPLYDSSDSLGRCERHCVGPSMHFTHRPLTWVDQTAADLTMRNTVEPFLNKKIVLIVRHPLDAITSHWFQSQFQVTPRYGGSLESFLNHPVYGLEKCFRFHHLWETGATRVSAFHLLRYEDMRVNPVQTFSELLRFLGVVIDRGIFDQAIEFTAFDNMKKLESSGQNLRYRSSGLRVFGPSDRKNPDSYHVRSGKIGGYKGHLEVEACARLESLVERELGAFYGYAGGTEPSGSVR